MSLDESCLGLKYVAAYTKVFFYIWSFYSDPNIKNSYIFGVSKHGRNLQVNCLWPGILLNLNTVPKSWSNEVSK
jgi:hypothetical protein